MRATSLQNKGTLSTQHNAVSVKTKLTVFPCSPPCYGSRSVNSASTLPVLDLKVQDCQSNAQRRMSTPADIHTAYTACGLTSLNYKGTHGLSSGSGCCIVRLVGEDAESVSGLVDFADDFFAGVDNESANRAINNVGVFRISNNVHAGFDKNVNGDDKMQVCYTKLIPPKSEAELPILLPLEVGELVGESSLSDGCNGMKTLFSVSAQLTRAVLGMTKEATDKLLDDSSLRNEEVSSDEMDSANIDNLTDNVSNSYQRLIRYSSGVASNSDDTAAFWPHVDSTLLTLIPMPEIPGLEVWAPSLTNSKISDLSGEWVRPIKPTKSADGEIYVIALAGEFMELLSDGKVPTCIHRVMPQNTLKQQRISAPLFVRPRRSKHAVLNLAADLSLTIGDQEEGMYHQKGLMEECDQMRVWDYMEIMSPDN